MMASKRMTVLDNPISMTATTFSDPPSREKNSPGGIPRKQPLSTIRFDSRLSEAEEALGNSGSESVLAVGREADNKDASRGTAEA